MKTIEFLTAMVIAKRSLDLPVGEDTTLWADLVLAQGFDFEEIKNLITIDRRASKAQYEKAMDDCLTRLGLEIVDEKSAHLLLVWAYIQKLLKSSEFSAIDFLEMMEKLCVDFGHEPVYMQFYLLQCARKDLGKGTIVFHDRELNEHNFEQVLRWEIDLFLDQNERTITDWIKIKDEKK